MEMNNETGLVRQDAQCRMGIAIDALSAVRDLCCEAAAGQLECGLHQVNADHFASLLGLILSEMRACEDVL